MLSLNVAGLFPADQETEMCVTRLQSIHESPPLADKEMLLVEYISQTLVPPVCCRLRHQHSASALTCCLSVQAD